MLSTPRANCIRPATVAPIPKAAESSNRASDRSSAVPLTLQSKGIILLSYYFNF
jgi:hypothetical protein